MTVLSWTNYADDATLTDSTNTQSPVPGAGVLAIDNVKTRQLSDVYRYNFTGAGTVIIDIDHGAGKTPAITLIGLLNMKGVNTPDYTVSFGTSAGASDVGQETGTLWTRRDWETHNYFIYISTRYAARYMRIEVDVALAGNFDLGRLWLDDAWIDPDFSMDFTVNINDPSPLVKSTGGTVYSSARSLQRSIDCRVYGVTDADFVGDGQLVDPSLLVMHMVAGTSGEVVCLPLVDTEIHIRRLGTYGHIKSNQGIRVLDKGANGHIVENRFTIEEDF